MYNEDVGRIPTLYYYTKLHCFSNVVWYDNLGGNVNTPCGYGTKPKAAF